VQQALKTSGLKDDTTCVVVDIIPSDHLTSPQLSPKKNQNKLKSLFRRRSHSSVGKLGGKSASFGSVEELFEEGSAMLEERYVIPAIAPTALFLVNFFVIAQYHLHLCYLVRYATYWTLMEEHV